MGNKIKIFECYRTLLYAPLYHVVEFKNQYGLDEFEIKFGTNPIDTLGDLGALNAMVAESNDSNSDFYPVAICDPFINLNSGNLHNSNVRLISTLIDRIAIWVVGLRYRSPSTQTQSRHNKLLDKLKKNDFSTFITDIISNNNIICYASEAYTTSSIYNHFFKLAGLPDSNQLNSLEILNTKAEKDILTKNINHLLLTNNPWAIDDLLKLDPNTKKYGIEIIRDFGPMFVPFTGILSTKQFVEYPTDINPLDDFIQAIGVACERIYKEPESIIADLVKLDHKYFNIKVTGNYFKEIIEKSINHIIHHRIYNTHALTSYCAWNAYGNKILSHNGTFLLNSYKTYAENYIAEKYLCKNHLLIN